MIAARPPTPCVWHRHSLVICSAHEFARALDASGCFGSQGGAGGAVAWVLTGSLCCLLVQYAKFMPTIDAAAYKKTLTTMLWGNSVPPRSLFRSLHLPCPSLLACTPPAASLALLPWRVPDSR